MSVPLGQYENNGIQNIPNFPFLVVFLVLPTIITVFCACCCAYLYKKNKEQWQGNGSYKMNRKSRASDSPVNDGDYDASVHLANGNYNINNREEDNCDEDAPVGLDDSADKLHCKINIDDSLTYHHDSPKHDAHLMDTSVSHSDDHSSISHAVHSSDIGISASHHTCDSGGQSSNHVSDSYADTSGCADTGGCADSGGGDCGGFD